MKRNAQLRLSRPETFADRAYQQRPPPGHLSDPDYRGRQEYHLGISDRFG